MGSNNPRFACTNPGCNAKITRNQLYGSNGRCIYCKVHLTHTNWMTGRQGSLQMMLELDKATDDELLEVCKEAGIDVKDAIRAAIAIKVREWTAVPGDTDKRVKQDLMLAKLYRR